jgi:putative Mg2+ transporter-C (MgtC) family protein
LGVLTLWLLKWVDVVIPRQHRATLTIACDDAQWDVVEKIPRLLEPMQFRARFQEQRRHPGSEAADYVFELTWRRPEQACPPVEVLRLIDQAYRVKSFELTTENAR